MCILPIGYFHYVKDLKYAVGLEEENIMKLLDKSRKRGEEDNSFKGIDRGLFNYALASRSEEFLKMVAQIMTRDSFKREKTNFVLTGFLEGIFSGLKLSGETLYKWDFCLKCPNIDKIEKGSYTSFPFYASGLWGLIFYAKDKDHLKLVQDLEFSEEVVGKIKSTLKNIFREIF